HRVSRIRMISWICLFTCAGLVLPVPTHSGYLVVSRLTTQRVTVMLTSRCTRPIFIMTVLHNDFMVMVLMTDIPRGSLMQLVISPARATLSLLQNTRVHR